MIQKVQQNTPTQVNLSLTLPRRQTAVPAPLDAIRFGKTPSKVMAFFKSIWVNFRLILSKIFWCFDSIKPLSAKQEKIQKQITMLQGHLHNFNERVQKQDLPTLKQWWNQAFEDLDYDLRKKIIFKDIESYAGGASDKNAWAKENYNDYRQLATDFVQKLSIVEEHNPLEYIPGYLKEVIEDLEKEIKNQKK